MEYKNNTLTITRELNASIDSVWNALTDNSLIKQWVPFFPDFKAEVGHESRFLLGPDKDHEYLHICKVIEVIPQKKLSYTWGYAAVEGASVVSFNLENGKTGDTAQLVFTHTITKPFATEDSNFGPSSFIQGWTSTVDSLQKFVESKKAE